MPEALPIARPRLNNVTLCCVDTLHPELALLAMHRSRARCDFAAAILLTDRPLDGDGVRIQRIEPIAGLEAYSDFMMRRLYQYIETDFALVVQWDGFVVDGSCWDPEFLNYDYIGAPWRWDGEQPVGNGGFSLRSRRLLAELQRPEFPPGHPEDQLIGRRYYPELIRRGIEFAPLEVARRFAFESWEPDGPTFGFHGMFHLWRFMSAPDLNAVMALLSPEIVTSEAARELLALATREKCWDAAAVAFWWAEAVLGEAYAIEWASAGTVTLERASQLRAEIYRNAGLRPPGAS